MASLSVLDSTLHSYHSFLLQIISMYDKDKAHCMNCNEKLI